MKAKVKKPIYLPGELLRTLRLIARSEGKTLNTLIEETLRKRKGEYLWAEFKAIQSYWSGIAREKGIRTEADLQRYLTE